MDDQFQALYDRAMKQGLEAGKVVIPAVMNLVRHKNPLDNKSPVVERYTEYDWACGFAWVNVKPGTSKFARWLKQKGYAKTDSYYGGVTIWIKDHDQSYTRKNAHANVTAFMLQNALPNCKINAGSRLD